tara:strand:- start:292 stop:456 length:165 start_codon:yes stop_codon:yes gene_type:complete
MIKFIVPVVIIFLIVLYWEKISEVIFKKFNIKINYLLLGAISLIILAIYFLIKN